MTRVILLFLAILFPISSLAQNLVSPCPNLFTYDPEGVVGDRWFGTLQVKLEKELTGIWLKTIFDRPLLELGTDFGEAVMREPNEILIRRPKPKVNAGETLIVRIFARFELGQGAPRLLGFRLNGETICPENGIIPPASPLLEDLVSPCPALFSYEPLRHDANMWYGNVNVQSKSDLSGVWMRFVLDKPPIQFSTDFGESVQREPNEFLIKNPKHKVKSGEVLQYRISVNFIPGETPPKLLGYRLNAETVCPENGQIAKPVEELISPCPNLFVYEQTRENDQWHGNIDIRSDSALAGVWMRVIFDKPPLELLTDFGEAVKRDTNDYLIKNPKHKLNAGDLLHVRLTVRFNAGEPAPRLIGFRLNARTVCPENGAIESAAPTLSLAQQLVSPCPGVFDYEPPGTDADKWYGNINIQTQVELAGLWINVILDGQSVQLGNWFGEVQTDNNIKYLIKSPTHKLKPGNTAKLRFYVKFNPSEPVPKLKEIRVNALTVCPSENMIIVPDIQPFMPTTESIDWITFPANKPVGEKPIFGPDARPDYKPTFAIQTPAAAAASGEQCGVVATKPIALISHGIATEEGMWPWHAALYYPNGAYLEYYCGGTLITLRHVLTVAHCVATKYTVAPLSTDDIQVFLGKYLLSKSNRGVQYMQVKKISIHPEYETANYGNDIGLLHLTRSADYTDWVRPICLWAESTDINSIVDKQGTVVGWGYDNAGRVSDRLLRANMPVVGHQKCKWSKKSFYSQKVNDRNFCAGFRNGTSVCTGDSGGGFAFRKSTSGPNNPQWHLRGLVSIGVALQSDASLCDTSHYVIFTDVAKFLDWIKHSMNN